MRSLKISIGLLIIILISSFIYIVSLNKKSKQFTINIHVLEEMVSNNDWDNAKKQLISMEKDWGKTERWMTTLIDHQEVDSINLSLVRLSRYLQYEEVSDLMVECATLRLLIEHIPKKEKFNLSNLF